MAAEMHHDRRSFSVISSRRTRSPSKEEARRSPSSGDPRAVGGGTVGKEDYLGYQCGRRTIEPHRPGGGCRSRPFGGDRSPPFETITFAGPATPSQVSRRTVEWHVPVRYRQSLTAVLSLQYAAPEHTLCMFATGIDLTMAAATEARCSAEVRRRHADSNCDRR